MSGFSLGFIFEAIVAILLVVTISYCFIVNRKLESLRSDKSDLRAIIRDLYGATGHAEQAFGTLRNTTDSVEHTLGEQIARAQKVEKSLSADLQRAEALLSKLSVIVRADASRGVSARNTTTAGTSNRKTSSKGGGAPAEHSRTTKLRHSEMGLGLLNSAQHGNDSSAGIAKKVA